MDGCEDIASAILEPWRISSLTACNAAERDLSSTSRAIDFKVSSMDILESSKVAICLVANSNCYWDTLTIKNWFLLVLPKDNGVKFDALICCLAARSDSELKIPLTFFPDSLIAMYL